MNSNATVKIGGVKYHTAKCARCSATVARVPLGFGNYGDYNTDGKPHNCYPDCTHGAGWCPVHAFRCPVVY